MGAVTESFGAMTVRGKGVAYIHNTMAVELTRVESDWVLRRDLGSGFLFPPTAQLVAGGPCEWYWTT